MRHIPWLLAALFSCALAATARADDTNVKWKKTVVDKVFRSEGVAVADVNKDGKLDVLNGEAWYEAPDWKMHEIRKLGDYKDGLSGYSKSFACWTDDFNGDGYQDLIVIGFPGEPCHWFENPKGKDGHWKQHELWHSACNETPQYVDLFGNGKRVLIMGFQPKGKTNEGQMAWFAPGDDATKPWVMHPISEPSAPGKEIPGTQRFSHGLGVTDVNADGKLDVVCTGGWWEQPAKDDGKPWKFHAGNLGPACADMYAIDLDNDKKREIISTSAHKYGIWSYHPIADKDGKVTWNQKVLFKDLVSETHALNYADINGDGKPDLITGKRWWSHGKGEPGSDKASMLYWFEAKTDKDGVTNFIPREIDNDSGIGTQFAVTSINGDKWLDVITSNKKGTFILEQVRDKK